MAAKMLSVFQFTISSAASATTLDTFVFPRGLMARIGFGLVKPRLAKAISMLIHLL